MQRLAPGIPVGIDGYDYPVGQTVVLTALPVTGQTFTGWRVDGADAGWSSSLTITMSGPHTVQATFVATTNFGDVSGNREDAVAIAELASRGTIRGYTNGNYGPDDGVQRAQMAALIARATSAGPGTPTGGTLTPPDCLVPGSWDCEDWGNNFQDRNGLDANLWRNVGALQHYRVAFGYDAASCTIKRLPFPLLRADRTGELCRDVGLHHPCDDRQGLLGRTTGRAAALRRGPGRLPH